MPTSTGRSRHYLSSAHQAPPFIWTRSRRAPDLTPTLRRWLQEAGLIEHALHAPNGVLFSVGVHRFDSVPVPLSAPGRLFQLVT